MNSTPLTLPLKVGGFLGFLATAMIGWHLADSPPPRPASTVEAPSKKRADRPARHARASGPATLAGKRLDPIRAATTPAARIRATVDLANSLPPSEFAAWLDGGFFTLRDGPELTLFTKILQERWQKEDPDGLLAWSLKKDSGQGDSVLADWAKNDPQRLLAFFKTHPDNQQELRALHSVVESNPKLALQRIQEMAASGISRNDISYAYSILNKLAEKSPAALEAAMDSLPPLMKQQAESALIGERLKTSFSKELHALWERPDGWKIFMNFAEQGDGRGAKIFDELANLPPAWRAKMADNTYYFIDRSNPGKWLEVDLTSYGFTDYQVKEMRRRAFQMLANTQPELAIKRLDEFGENPDTRRNTLSNIISSAKGDKDKINSLIASLGNEEDRKTAQSILDRRAQQDPSESKIEKPAEWLEQVGTLDLKTVSPYSYFRMLADWDPKKVSQLSSQFKDLPDEKKLTVARTLATSINYSNGMSTSAITGDAVRYLVTNSSSLPEDQRNSSNNPLQLSSNYAVRLAVKDPTAAADWVQSLPTGESKLWAQKNLASNWVQYDPKAVDQWLKTLPADARSEVTQHLEKKR